MKTEVLTFPEEILEQAVKCLKDHSCLNGQRRDVCEVDYSVQDGVVFIKEREMTPCFYYNCFGNSHFCACPVRKKIFLEYSI